MENNYYLYKMFLRNKLNAGRITLCATSVSSSQGIARTSKNEEATIEDETDGADTNVEVEALSIYCSLTEVKEHICRM